MTKKYQIGLDEQTLDLVRQASGKDGMGGYVHSLVTQRHDKWTAALTWLQENGWTDDDIAAACKTLEAHNVTPSSSLTEQMADTLRGAYEEYAAEAEISKDRWNKLTEEVRTNEPAALHLWILVDEFATDNQELAARLGLTSE